MNRFLFNFFYLKTSIRIQRYNINVKRSIFISRILRNTFPVKFYYHFSLVNWTAATESATSSEHAHCAWYEMPDNVIKRMIGLLATLACSAIHLASHISHYVRMLLLCYQCIVLYRMIQLDIKVNGKIVQQYEGKKELSTTDTSQSNLQGSVPAPPLL